jgi:hypothetical protein
MASAQAWRDDDLFCVRLNGARWTLVFSFSKKLLSKGASLARMMNLEVRRTLTYSSNIVPEEELRAVSKIAMQELRGLVEGYFDDHGLRA